MSLNASSTVEYTGIVTVFLSLKMIYPLWISLLYGYQITFYELNIHCTFLKKSIVFQRVVQLRLMRYYSVKSNLLLPLNHKSKAISNS